jgi:hypothetical protein
VESTARLPPEKIVKCIEEIQAVAAHKTVTLKRLQQLIGLLNFACQVVLPGRAFLRRLIDLTIGLRLPHHHRRLTVGSRLDLELWLQFLQSFNGKCFFLEDKGSTSDSLHLYTDAAQGLGYGALLGQQYFYGRWPTAWSEYNIVTLEFYPIVLAIRVWGSTMANQAIVFHTDNLALVHIINKQSSKDKPTMVLVRQLVLLCLQYNILFTAVHIPGKYNNLCDSLSRLQIARFHRLAPWADARPVRTPPVPLLLDSTKLLPLE